MVRIVYPTSDERTVNDVTRRNRFFEQEPATIEAAKCAQSINLDDDSRVKRFVGEPFAIYSSR